jgi:hypothetical protein
MNSIELVVFCLMWVVQIIGWIFPALFVIYALMGFLAWLLAIIKRDGLPETIFNGFAWLMIATWAGMAVMIIFRFMGIES